MGICTVIAGGMIRQRRKTVSNEALLKNAIRVLVRPNGLEEVRKNIKDAEYYFGLIDDENVFLNNLIWMGPPGPWQPYTKVATKEGKVYEKIVPKVESRSLRDVAEGICLEYSGDTSEDNTPEQLLTALYQESDWFGRHLSFGKLGSRDTLASMGKKHGKR